MTGYFSKIGRDIENLDIDDSLKILKSSGFLPLSDYVPVPDLFEFVKEISFYNSEMGLFLCSNFSLSLLMGYPQKLFSANFSADSFIFPFAHLASDLAFSSKDGYTYLFESSVSGFIFFETLALRLYKIHDFGIKKRAYLTIKNEDFLTLFYLFIIAYILGVVGKSSEKALLYANERIQGGRPISTYFPISDKIARMREFLEIVSNAGTNISLKIDEIFRQKRISDVSLFYQNLLFSLRYSLRESQNLISESIQIHGGYGYMKDYRIEKLFREIRTVASLVRLNDISTID